MIVVIADDFSGAAEIGGIAHRYGLKTEIQTAPHFESDADVIVLDAATRSMKKQEAVATVSAICGTIKQLEFPIKIFKKVDSVMRGHLVPEIEVLHNCFAFDRIFLMPANPKKDRKIIKGHYLVQGVPLDKTVFAHDPDFPIHSSDIGELIESQSPVLPHVHITPSDNAPVSSLITGDIAASDELKSYILKSGDHDLFCGGAEFFEAFLKHEGHSIRQQNDFITTSRYQLIINGSTVKNQKDEELLHKASIRTFSLPGTWKGNKIVMEPSDEEEWHEKIVEFLLKSKMAGIQIDLPINPQPGAGTSIAQHLLALVNFVIQKIERKDMHFILTGGATATEIIRKINSSQLPVAQEIAPGVVTLQGDDNTFFTTKPGSYTWPEDFLAQISRQ